jgi:hypothetical protein
VILAESLQHMDSKTPVLGRNRLMLHNMNISESTVMGHKRTPYLAYGVLCSAIRSRHGGCQAQDNMLPVCMCVWINTANVTVTSLKQYHSSHRQAQLQVTGCSSLTHHIHQGSDDATGASVTSSTTLAAAYLW